VTGNIEDALLLSQIIYWTDRTKMEDGWFAKSYAEWQNEIALSKYQVMAATKRLKEAGIETMVRKFNGAPTVHYRLRKSDFAQWIVKKLDERKLRNLTNDSEETSLSSTETTPKTTPKTVATDNEPAIAKTLAYPSNPVKWKDEHYAQFYTLNGMALDVLMELDGYAMTRFSELTLAEKRRFVRVCQELTDAGIAPGEYRDLLMDKRREWGGAPITMMPQHVTKYRLNKKKEKGREPGELSSYEIQKRMHQGMEWDGQL
jgi:hypothetical protein